MHARVSGLADYLATDEIDAIRSAAISCPGSTGASTGPAPSMPADDRVHDPDELLGIASADLRSPSTPATCWPGWSTVRASTSSSRCTEPSLVTGWASIHGYPIGVLANHRGVLFSEEADKATH